jgi:hypothetical protein
MVAQFCCEKIGDKPSTLVCAYILTLLVILNLQFMMSSKQIGKAINPEFFDVYVPTTEPTKLVFEDGSIKVGYFNRIMGKSEELEKFNQYTFIEFGEKAKKYKETGEEQYVTVIAGDNLTAVEYPSSR